MRAQSVAGEPGEVVLVRPRADRGVCVGHRDEIAFPLLRHFIARGGAFSMTSSARPSSGSGTVRPSVLDVFLLIASSTFTAFSTGRSAGLAPFRILPT